MKAAEAKKKSSHIIKIMIDMWPFLMISFGIRHINQIADHKTCHILFNFYSILSHKRSTTGDKSDAEKALLFKSLIHSISLQETTRAIWEKKIKRHEKTVFSWIGGVLSERRKYVKKSKRALLDHIQRLRGLKSFLIVIEKVRKRIS